MSKELQEPLKELSWLELEQLEKQNKVVLDNSPNH